MLKMKRYKTIRHALASRDPQLLLGLSKHFSIWEKIVGLRGKLRGLTINPNNYDLLFQWLWHQDATIAKMVKAIVLLIDDIDMQVDIFEKILGIDAVNFPYQLSYNFSEKEFLIDLPGVPGIGVSHYGRDDVAIDQFLLVLERLYARIYPEKTPAFFRT